MTDAYSKGGARCHFSKKAKEEAYERIRSGEFSSREEMAGAFGICRSTASAWIRDSGYVFFRERELPDRRTRTEAANVCRATYYRSLKATGSRLRRERTVELIRGIQERDGYVHGVLDMTACLRRLGVGISHNTVDKYMSANSNTIRTGGCLPCRHRIGNATPEAAVPDEWDSVLDGTITSVSKKWDRSPSTAERYLS